MSGRLIYGVLLLASAAMLLFVAGFVCLRLGLALLTALLYGLAGKIMLLAFGLLVLLAVVMSIRAVGRELAVYFSREAVALRRFLSLRARWSDSQLRLRMEARQLRYWQQFKQRRLLAANNRKHLRALFQAVNRELQAVKSQLPADSYKQLHKALRNHHKRADAQAILALRRQIPCR